MSELATPTQAIKTELFGECRMSKPDRSKISAYKFPSGINLSKAATEQRLSASIQGRP